MANVEMPLVPSPPRPLATRNSTGPGGGDSGGSPDISGEQVEQAPRIQYSDEPCCASALKQPTVQVIIAVVIGAILGTLTFKWKGEEGFDWWVPDVGMLLSTPGRLWLKALKCIVLPMIIFAMIDAMIMMRSLPGAKYVATSLLKWYTILPLSAGTQAIIYANLVVIPNMEPVAPTTAPRLVGAQKPPQNLLMQEPPQILVAQEAISGLYAENTTNTTAPTSEPPPSLLETLLGICDNMVPKNLVMEMYADNLLPVIVAALTFGLLVRDKDENGEKTSVMLVVQDMNAVVFSVIGGLMSVTPYAISSLVFGAVFANGLEGIASAQILILGTVTTLFSHFFVYYPIMLTVFGRRQPFRYMLNAAPAFMQALGTASSAAALPVSINVAIEKNKIAPHIAQFVISLGATIGMDGTAMYLITAVIFIGSLHGKIFGIGDFITLVLMAALSAAGSAPIPNASLFLLAVIAKAVGIDVTTDDIAIIAAVDWALDRLRTTVNVAGDQVVSAILDVKFGSQADDAGDMDMGPERMTTFLQEQVEFQRRRTRTKSLVLA